MTIEITINLILILLEIKALDSVLSTEKEKKKVNTKIGHVSAYTGLYNIVFSLLLSGKFPTLFKL